MTVRSLPPPTRASQDGLVLDPERRRVRFRRDPAGIIYELRSIGEEGAESGAELGAGSELGLEVVKVDEVIGTAESLGALRRTRLGWRSDPAPGASAARKDILRDIARTWSRLPYLTGR